MANPRKTVLLAEDDALVALDLKGHFIEHGYAVLGPFAKSAAAAEAIGRHKPDIAIIDFHLQDGTAEGLAAALEKAAVPYAIVTVASQDKLPKSVSPIGFFEKPFDIVQLSDLVSDAP
ncbi:hypothetical protein AADZ90_006700 [Aestuariibius sp. 2305UL40-4]|uniref:hypothetical protein n=1 Tax=Aestuariibius violaceus TaxID=3234132 RepID=UPI00345EDC42